jgi:hypothetical protein
MMSEPGVTQLVDGLRIELGLADRPAPDAKPSLMSTIASAIGLGARRPA